MKYNEVSKWQHRPWLGALRPGDIYTHCFHPYPSTIMQLPDGGVEPAVRVHVGSGRVLPCFVLTFKRSSSLYLTYEEIRCLHR